MFTKDEYLGNFPRLLLKENNHNNEGTIYFYDDETIMKIFDKTLNFSKEIERNIEFLIHNRITNTPSIYEKIIIDNEFRGYLMEYIDNSYTFRSAIEHEFSIDEKINAIKNVYEALKQFHINNIYLGDIHSDNFLITTDGKGYIIDLECIRFPGDENKFRQCYLIKPNNESYRLNDVNKYTDNIKVMISSLSLLLNIDLEKYISNTEHDIKLEEIYRNIIIPLNNDELSNYFLKLINKEETEYFSEHLDLFKLTSKNNVQMIKSY